MRIIIKPVALKDIEQTVNYIESELSNTQAAKSIQKIIFDGIERLQNNPKLGKVLPGSDYRYIIVKNYLVFYRIIDTNITVTRVLDGRTDYIKTLF